MTNVLCLKDFLCVLTFWLLPSAMVTSSLLDSISGTCIPNLTAIANQGLPKGAGRKSGVPKHKRRSAVPIQSRSICPCLLKAKTAACRSSLQQKQSVGSSDLQTPSSGILSLQHPHVAGHDRPVNTLTPSYTAFCSY